MINGLFNFLIFIFIGFVIYLVQDAKYNDKMCDLYYKNFKLREENKRLKNSITKFVKKEHRKYDLQRK